MGKEKLSLRRQLNAPGTAGEKADFQAVLQFADGLADGRLADVKLLCGPGNVPCFCHLVKNFKKYSGMSPLKYRAKCNSRRA